MATIDYKEKYEQALEVAQRFYNNSVAVTKKGLEDIFPELKESGDESVRKALIEFVQGMYTGCRTEEACKERDMYLAWLEKQGEHANFRNKIQIGDKVTRNEDGVLVNLSQLNRVAKKQGEQNLADKIESKFEIGDLITNGILVGVIDEIHELGYHAYFGDHYADVPDVENWHKWTIQDAKDGDVLNSTRVQATIIFKGFAEDGKHINAYCALQSGIFIHQEILWDRDFEPASKNWGNALFDAMKEAGYEWDVEKKELKMIEQKPQSTWKPSEQDILLLERIANGKSDPQNFQASLGALIVQLKKLREE